MDYLLVLDQRSSSTCKVIVPFIRKRAARQQLALHKLLF
jgi:hypothetical protein